MTGWSVDADLEIALLDRLREQHDRLGALDLEDRRIQRIDLTIAPNFTGPKNVTTSSLASSSHLVAVQRTRLLDRNLE